MSDSSDEITEPVDAVADADGTDDTSAAPDAEAGPALSGDDPVRTVTRKGAVLGAAGALVVGGLVGWVAADTFGDDEDSIPISAFQEGGGGRVDAWGRGPMGGSWFFHRGPGGPFGQGSPGRGGGWHEDGDRGVPPWMEEDGERGVPPWMDEDGDHDDGGHDDGDPEDGDGDDDQDGRDQREAPSSTTEGDR